MYSYQVMQINGENWFYIVRHRMYRHSSNKLRYSIGILYIKWHIHNLVDICS